jgi:hypothetical protein
VQFAGLSPGFVGLAQINIQLPANLPSGALPLAISFPGDNAAPVNLYVQGNIAGAAPQISVSPASLNFGNVTVGQSASLTLTVKNTGNATLNVTALNVSGAAFQVTSPSGPFNVAAGASAAITVSYTAAAGTQTGVLSIASNDPANPTVTVALTGAGVSAASASLSVSPSGLNFSSVPEGLARQLSVTVNNTGSAALTVTGLTVGGAFSIVSPATPFTVTPGGFSKVVLEFSPVAAGGQAATLNIASNDPAQPNLAYSIWGTGLNPANVLVSDSFNRANATECSLGASDLSFGGIASYYYLPDWPSNNGPIGASIVSGVLQNNGRDFGGVQLTASPDTCGAVRGASLPQDLDMIADFYVPGSTGKITDAGLYFRSRAAAPGDGLFGGTSSGYLVELFSTGEVWVDQMNPFEPIAKSPVLLSFDATLVHTLEAQVEGPVLQVTLDGKPVTFTQNGASVTTVAVSSAPADGAVGISFGSEDNRGLAGGQSASNLVISLPASLRGAAQVAASPAK